MRQILSVTCDNASNNDTMVTHLADLIKAFGGDYARTRCFLHILNLTAQSLIKQFDVKAVQDVEQVDDDVRRLLELAREIEAEREAGGEADSDEGVGEDEDRLLDDDDESWVDEVASLNDAEREEFEEEVRPVKMTLAKVSKPAARPERSFASVSRLDRSAAWHSRLSIRLRSSCRRGIPSCRNKAYRKNSSPAMSEQDGTPLMICWMSL